MSAPGWAILMALAVGGLLAAHHAKNRTGIWIAKPLASTIFVAAALSHGARDSAYGKAVLAALVLGWFGDVLIIPKTRGPFLAGVASFLAGHLAYVAAFVIRGVDPPATAAAALAMLVPAGLAWRWVSPHLPPEGGLRGPVAAYAVMLTAMVAFATGSFIARPAPLLLVAAVTFFLSDLSVARERFVRSDFTNKLWGLPLYYAAQLVFALTTGA